MFLESQPPWFLRQDLQPGPGQLANSRAPPPSAFPALGSQATITTAGNVGAEARAEGLTPYETNTPGGATS